MACYDTEDNKRSAYTKQTLRCLVETVDFTRHRLAITDNGSQNETLSLLSDFAANFPVKDHLHIFYNETNVGTARAINMGLKQRKPGEHAIKMDNDCVIDAKGWVDVMEACINREPRIGIVALKRMDLQDMPNAKNAYYRSELIMLPHQPGQQWLIVEKVNHIMGTCEMLSSSLLEKIGGFEQPTVYGFDDTIVFHKSLILKFMNVYLPHIVIHHLDTGGTEHTMWKVKHSQDYRKEVDRMIADLTKGRRPIYYPID